MAKLGGFLQVADIRGKLGGNVFSKSRSGHVLRARVKPRNPRSTSQTSVRALLAAGARVAKALGSSDLADWKAYAASITKHQSVSGAAYNPSFITALVGLYSAFKLATPAGSFPTSPPATPYVGDTITITAAGTSGTITITGSAQQTSGSTTFLYAQLLKSANRTPASVPGKLISVAPIPATPFHVAVAGLAAGVYSVGYRFVKLSTGQEAGFVLIGNITVT